MNNQIMSKTFGWMFIGLLVTFLTGYFVSLNPNMLLNVMSTGGLLIIIIVEIALVIFLSSRITKMSPTTAKISFLLYSFVSGLTFSSIFVIYEMSSIMFIFLATAITFAIFAAIGALTNIDLTKLGTYLLMALFGVIICTIINFFLNSSSFDLALSVIIILIFIGFTAYDVQKIKRLGETNFLKEDNLAIYGALELYLDFINLFIHLLSLFGKARDN